MMSPTSPVPIAPPGSRAAAGLFAAKDADLVVSNLREELRALETTVEDILSKYAEAVHDEGRRDRAASTLTHLLEEKLEAPDLHLIVEVLYFAGYQRLLARHKFRFPAYNVLEGYFVNATSEPWAPVVDPRPSVPGRSWSLFGRRIGFPIGVPASVLTDNHRWVKHLANNGFNVLTYRTVRSRAHSPNSRPNWSFVPDHRAPFKLTGKPEVVTADPWDWVDPGTREVTTTNSFGVPSHDPALWMDDLEKALETLANDQLLLVSVLGDDYDASPARADIVAADFAATAALAEEAGAPIIELNLSCPNSVDPRRGEVKPPLCSDVETTWRVLNEVREHLNDKTQLVAKLSYLDEHRLAELVHRIAPLVDGIAGINTLQCTVQRVNGEPTFPGRTRAGVSGIAVRNHAIDFVARLARLRLECGEYFEILGMGGVTDPASFSALYELGASAVQTASGAFANPFLADECVTELGSVLPDAPDIGDAELVSQLRSLITSAIAKASSVSRSEVASKLPLRPAQTFRLLESMEHDGDLETVSGDSGLYRVVAHRG
jgi:dihydroorotate dehydrogenase